MRASYRFKRLGTARFEMEHPSRLYEAPTESRAGGTTTAGLARSAAWISAHIITRTAPASARWHSLGMGHFLFIAVALIMLLRGTSCSRQRLNNQRIEETLAFRIHYYPNSSDVSERLGI